MKTHVPLALVTLALAVPLALPLAGCKGGNAIEGKWKLSGAGLGPSGGDATLNLEGGKSTMRVSMLTPQAGTFAVDATGTYEMKDESLTLTFTDAKLDDSGMTPAAKSLMANPAMQDAMKKQMSKAETFKTKFESSDTVLLTGTDGKTTTLTRVKG